MRITALRLATATTLAVLLAAGSAAAQHPSPYDTTFAIRGGGATPLLADMKAGAAVVGTIPAGAGGIVLRWCRKEIDFGNWQFGSRKDQLKILDARWCEVSFNGKVGNVPGTVLQPE